MPSRTNSISFGKLILDTPFKNTLALSPYPSTYIPGFDLILLIKLTLDLCFTSYSEFKLYVLLLLLFTIHPEKIKITEIIVKYLFIIFFSELNYTTNNN